MKIEKMYINGEWTESSSKAMREVINPATGEVIALVTDGTEEDVNAAVAAAKTAFYDNGWCDVCAEERAGYLMKIADELEKISGELEALETSNNGKPLRETAYDVADAISCFRYYASLARMPNGQTYEVADPMQAMVVREPIGVCGQITPWNFPFLMSSWKIAPALAAGNCVVFKPSEITPLTAIKLFEVIEKVGLPAGVANLVLGEGKVVGARIAEHMDVDKIAFTGGTQTGKSIMSAATCNVKKISLELGGKNPCVVFDDADFDTAVDYALFASFANQGQVCSAGSRIIVQDTIYDKFAAKLAERASKICVAPGDAEGVEMGPLVSEAHMNKVLGYIEIGKEEGATVLCGGERITTDGMEKGFFVQPTIFSDTTTDMRIVQEEIFGPVMILQKFSTEEEAIKIANDTIYGLAGGVFTQDAAKGMRFLKKLRAGITWLNSYHPTYNEAPWGGYKQSGIGRELGSFGLDEYTEVKQININLEVEPVGWFEN